MYAFRGNDSTIFIFASSISGGGIKSKREEFAPLGANSALLELIPFWNGFVILGNMEIHSFALNLEFSAHIFSTM